MSDSSWCDDAWLAAWARVIGFVLMIAGLCFMTLIAGCSASKSSWMDSFESRRETLLKRTADMRETNDSSRSYVHKALALLWLKKDVKKANELLTHDLILKASFDESPFILYWSMPALVRTYILFNNTDGQVDKLLDDKTQQGLIDVFWKFVVEREKGLFSVDNNPWRIVGSENHDMLQKSTVLLIAQILKDMPGYRDRSLPSGMTLGEIYDHAIQFFHRYFTERAKHGLLIEGGGPYVGVTLEGIYNIRDFAGDQSLSQKAEMFLNVFWIDYALESVNGIRGGAKSRVYRNWGPVGLFTDSILAGLYFGFEFMRSVEPNNTICMLTSDYQPPSIAEYFATQLESRGEFPYITRRPGTGTHVMEIIGSGEGSEFIPQQQPVYYATTDESTLCYTYVTPDYVMGSFMLRPWVPVTQLRSQNPWEGVVFSIGVDSRVYPYLDTDRSVHVPFMTMQNGPIMITQRSSRFTEKVGIHVSEDLIRSLQNDSGWLFGQAGNAFFAVKAVSGGLNWIGKTILLIDSSSPIVIHVGRKPDYASLDDFKKEIKSNILEYVNGVVRYVDKNWGEIVFKPAGWSPDMRLVDGQAIDYYPSNLFDSPYLRSEWGSGRIEVFNGTERLTYDFNF